MLKRRAPRMLVAGFLLTVTVTGLTACRTSPTVAAYVGDARITVDELESAVEDRLEDPDVAAYAEAQGEEFTRRVLTLLVQEEVHAVAAERFDVQVSDSDVRARIEQLLGQDDPDAVFAELAQQGIGRADVVENVRQQIVREEVAAAEGAAEPPTEEQLRARYAEVSDGLAEFSFGYIAVPDEATAAAVLAQLTADPASYEGLAAQYAGQLTLPALETRPPEELPAVLAEQIQAAAPNTGFTLAVPEAGGGVIVGFVSGVVVPSFEEVRPGLEREAAEGAQEAGTQLVLEVREDIGVTLNPRYGLRDEDGRLVPVEGGVVDILDGEDPAAAPAD